MPTLFLGLNEDVIPPPEAPTIVAVRAYVSRASDFGASDVHDTPDTHWIMGVTLSWLVFLFPSWYGPRGVLYGVA